MSAGGDEEANGLVHDDAKREMLVPGMFLKDKVDEAKHVRFHFSIADCFPCNFLHLQTCVFD